MPNSTIVWFRQDLRLDDQPALAAAIAQGGGVIPVYIWAPQEEGDWRAGGASQWWLHQSLNQLDQQLRSFGSRLIIRRGESLHELNQLIQETGAASVVWTRRYEPAAIERDKRVKAELRRSGIHAESFNGQLLFEPWDVQTKEKRPYQVFTAFWKSCLSMPDPAEPTAAPKTLKSPEIWPTTLSVMDLGLLPKIAWDAGLANDWVPGAGEAQRQFKRFLKSAILGYDQGRDLPAEPGTSRLSPYLHFGEISPRRIWHEIQHLCRSQPAGQATSGAETYLKELGWREFAHHLLFHFPQTPQRPLREDFARFPWVNDAPGLLAWQRGKTGYPIVDAGMRQLWATGWMHNRVRMIVASFLVKDLLIDWRRGAEWFWDTLVDADLSNNTLGWQWSAGCGADAAPYFRVFNPALQSAKFDPEGTYIRQWIPGLKKLAARWIHSPWDAPQDELARAGIELGKNYPWPIVDHSQARQQALQAFQQLKQRPASSTQDESDA